MVYHLKNYICFKLLPITPIYIHVIRLLNLRVKHPQGIDC